MYGRDAERRVVGELLQRATTAASSVLLVCGGRGMGKSALLREAGYEGSQRGFSLATGAADRIGGQLPLFALRMAVGFAADDDSAEPGPLPAQISRLRDRLVRRAETDPVLVTLDDLQWASPATLLALRVLPRELARYPIAWILTRSATLRDKDAARLFHALRGEGAFQAALQPLDTTAVKAMFIDAFGAPPGDALLELAAGAGGNPSLLSDLIDGLREEKAVRVADGVACLASSRLPRRILRAAREWLDVSECTRQVLRAAAVLGGEFRPGDVAKVIGTAPAVLLSGIEEALDAGILVAGEDTFSFRYSLVARAVAESVPQPVRRVLHRQFGEILLGYEGPAAEAAGHLLNGAAPGDPASLACLDDGAARILRWSPRTAAELAIRALEFTSPDDRAATTRAVAAAEALAAAGRPRQAARIAYETLARPVPAPLEARLQCVLASTLNMSGQAGDAAGQADKVLTSDDSHGVGDLALVAWLQAMMAHGYDERISPVVTGLASRPDEHAAEVLVAAGAVRAMLAWDEGRTAESLELLRAAVRRGSGVSPDARHGQPLLLLAARMIDLRQLGDAASLLQAADVNGPRDGLAALVASLLRARSHLATGQLDVADAHAAAALDAAESVGADAYASVARSLLAAIALRQGRANEASRRVTHCPVLPPNPAAVYAPAECWLVRAQVAVAAKGPAAGIGHILELGADPPAFRRVLLGDPAAPVWMVRTALTAHEQPLAGRVVAAVESLSSTDAPALRAAAAHARGLLAQDRDSLVYAAAHQADIWARARAAEDLAVLDATGIDWGAAVGRLNDAIDGYGKSGAAADLARVRVRLRDLGVRCRPWGMSPDRPASGWESLTDTERAVAELIAQGLTNRQAAGRLYFSPHTVAYHLKHAFRKLSIGSRVELARIVAERSSQPA